MQRKKLHVIQQKTIKVERITRKQQKKEIKIYEQNIRQIWRTNKKQTMHCYIYLKNTLTRNKEHTNINKGIRFNKITCKKSKIKITKKQETTT